MQCVCFGAWCAHCCSERDILSAAWSGLCCCSSNGKQLFIINAGRHCEIGSSVWRIQFCVCSKRCTHSCRQRNHFCPRRVVVAGCRTANGYITWSSDFDSNSGRFGTSGCKRKHNCTVCLLGFGTIEVGNTIAGDSDLYQTTKGDQQLVFGGIGKNNG